MFNGYCGEFLLLIVYLFYLDSGTACLQKTIYSFESGLFDSMQKSSKFLLEIMTLVS
jgi:hypothetical protein